MVGRFFTFSYGAISAPRRGRARKRPRDTPRRIERSRQFGYSTARAPAGGGRARAKSERPTAGHSGRGVDATTVETLLFFSARRWARSPCPLWARRAHSTTPLKRLPLKRRWQRRPCRCLGERTGRASKWQGLFTLATFAASVLPRVYMRQGRAMTTRPLPRWRRGVRERERAKRASVSVPETRARGQGGNAANGAAREGATASDSERGVRGAERVSGREDALRAPQRERTSGAKRRRRPPRRETRIKGATETEQTANPDVTTRASEASERVCRRYYYATVVLVVSKSRRFYYRNTLR